MAPELSVRISDAAGRIAGEATVPGLLAATARELVRLLDAERCAISRAVGDLLVEVTAYQPAGSTPQLDLYLASDYPLTQEVLQRGEPRRVSAGAAGADEAETGLLLRLGFTELLMLPLATDDAAWGLVEVYRSTRAFAEADVEAAEAILAKTQELLVRLERA